MTRTQVQVYLINEWLLERDDQTAWITLIAGEGSGMRQATIGVMTDTAVLSLHDPEPPAT